MEWHEFHVDSPLDWSRSFHPRSLEICLNYTGSADLREAGASERLANEQVAAYAVRDELVGAVREMGTIHRFFHDRARPGVSSQATGGGARWCKAGGAQVSGEPRALHAVGAHAGAACVVARAAATAPRAAGVAGGAGHLVFGKDPGDPGKHPLPSRQAGRAFCRRHKRINAERVERARFLLERDLCNPPSLEMLGQEVDCSPFYLSRLFTDQLGTSIPKYLRERRIERAAEMILGHGMSVTDAAMAVGYSSLSAFNKAFVNRFGQAPGRTARRPRGGGPCNPEHSEGNPQEADLGVFRLGREAMKSQPLCPGSRILHPRRGRSQRPIHRYRRRHAARRLAERLHQIRRLV